MNKRTAISTISAVAAILVLTPVALADKHTAGCTHVFDASGNHVMGGQDKNCVHSGMFKGKETMEACGAEKPKAPEPKKVEAEPAPAAPAPTPAPAPVTSTTERLTVDGKTLFATNSAVLTSAGQAAISNVVQQISSFDKVDGVSVSGHTDSRGSEAYNQSLSEKRAASVANYMISQGVSASLISSVGRGELEPVADNATADGRQQNRRVEIDVSGFKVK